MWDRFKQIATERGLTIEEAVRQLGVSRTQAFRNLRPGVPRSKFWTRLIHWSGGRITPNDLFADEIAEARRAKRKDRAA